LKEDVMTEINASDLEEMKVLNCAWVTFGPS